MSSNDFKEGDEVSWNWGTSHPSGTVAEVKTDGKLEIETKGKMIHKNASPDNPAVHVERQGNDVVKRASELTKQSSADNGDMAASSPQSKGSETAKESKGGESDEKQDKESSPTPNTAAGDKRKRSGDEDKATTNDDSDKSKKKRKASGKGAQKKEGGETQKRGRKPKNSAGDSKASGEEKKAHAEDKVDDGAQESEKSGVNVTKHDTDVASKPLSVDAPAAGTRSKDH